MVTNGRAVQVSDWPESLTQKLSPKLLVSFIHKIILGTLWDKSSATP